MHPPKPHSPSDPSDCPAMHVIDMGPTRTDWPAASSTELVEESDDKSRQSQPLQHLDESKQCTISCRALGYTVSGKRTRLPAFLRKKKTEPAETEPKAILSAIDAVFRPGRLTAIMGASGAGKTSLLNYLAGELSSKRAELTGEVRLNGHVADGKQVKRVSAFVFQDDIILPTMTVEEAVNMSAVLRTKAESTLERRQQVSDIIDELQLDKCRKTKIGDSMKKGVSGGERKRTALAMDLIVNPAVLFLDEPTSGLDTFTAHNVVSCLRELARKHNRTVVATLHQPSSEIFHMLDDLLLLSRGQVMYFGEAKAAVQYFAGLGYPCPTYNNPADYIFMRVLNETLPGHQREIPRLLEAWEKSAEHHRLLDELNAVEKSADGHDALRVEQRYEAPFVRQFAYLLGRAGKNVIRNVMLLQARVIQSIFIGLLLGLIYSDVSGKDAMTQVTNRLGALYFLVVNQFMASSMTAVNVLVAEKVVFKREYTAGYYRLPAYFFSKTLVELPAQIVTPLIVLATSYFLVGLRGEAGCFFLAWLITILLSMCGTALGTFAGASFRDISTGSVILSICLLPMIIFSGLLVNVKKVPIVFRWIPYIAPTRYGFTALARNELQDYTFPKCTPMPGLYDCRGNSALKYNELDKGPSTFVCLLALIASYVILEIFAYLALWRVSRKRSA